MEVVNEDLTLQANLGSELGKFRKCRRWSSLAQGE